MRIVTERTMTDVAAMVWPRSWTDRRGNGPDRFRWKHCREKKQKTHGESSERCNQLAFWRSPAHQLAAASTAAAGKSLLQSSACKRTAAQGPGLVYLVCCLKRGLIAASMLPSHLLLEVV